MKSIKHEPLALIAADNADLGVISAVMQDAIAKVGDLAFVPRQRRFALVANRFVWENGVRKAHGPFTRVRAGCHFDDVHSVRTRGLRQGAASAIVDVLALTFAPTEGGDGAGVITIALGGGGAIALDVDAINVTMRDISAPWRTSRRPDHQV